MTLTISHSGARSPDITAIFVFLVVAESTGLHFLLVRHHPVIAVISSLFGLLTVVWMIDDYIALGKSRSEIADGALVLRVGRRLAATIPLALLKDAAAAPAERPEKCLNVTKPAEPNVLLTFAEPVLVRLLGAVDRRVASIALYVDNPRELLPLITAPICR